MAIQNTGKPTEREFQSQVRKAGGWYHRFTDKAEVVGLNRGVRIAAFPSQPADYLVAVPWWPGLFLAEVKSVSRSITSIPSNLFEKGQLEAIAGSKRHKDRSAVRTYFCFLHVIPENIWYIFSPQDQDQTDGLRFVNFGEPLWPV